MNDGMPMAECSTPCIDGFYYLEDSIVDPDDLPEDRLVMGEGT